MKTIVFLIIILLAGYMLYNYFFGDTASAKADKNKELTAQDYASRQLEAQDLLRTIYQKQESFHARWGHYTYKFDSLEIVPQSTFYRVRMMDAKINFFEARAEGNIDKDGTVDVWVITEDGTPKCVVSDAEK
jgi:hypothetical protein